MAAIVINEANFQQEVMESEKPVLLDFWAPWCGPCRAVLPLVEEIAEERADIKVCKINVDEEKGLAKQFRVMSIPTLFLIPEKDTPIFVYCHSGARSRRMAGVLQKLGYTNVTDIGGIVDYQGPLE